MESRDGAMKSWSTYMAQDNDSQKDYNASFVQLKTKRPYQPGKNFYSNHQNSDFIQQFRNWMISIGMTPPTNIFADGEIHRFSTNNKPSDTAGWYCLYSNAIPAGSCGDWRTNKIFTWCSRSRDQMSSAEWIAHQRQRIEAQRQHNQVRAQMQQLAAQRALELWQNAQPANSNHPYLRKKQILPLLARQKGDALVLPLTDFNGALWSLQFIQPDGTKKLLSGGAKKGRFIPVNLSSVWARLLIGEGFSTCATLAQAYPSDSVIAAIDAGNLEAVAIGARKNWPEAEIIICADDDRLLPENVGIIKGQAAAIASHALFTSPKWPEDTPKILSDFNDLACWLASKGAL